MSQYKINQPIRIRYLASSLEEGLTDLTLTPTNPSGADETPIVLSEIGDGLYETTFTPDVLGWWWVRISSATKPLNVFSKNYFIEPEYTELLGKSTGTYYPLLDEEDLLIPSQIAPIKINKDGLIETRSAVLTDEGSFYEPFSGTELGDGWISIIGSEASISVVNSQCTIISGNTNNASSYISKYIDYCPISITSVFSISQRILNQDLYFGLSSSETPNAAQRVRFHFFGTDNTKIALESQSSYDTGGDEGTNIQVLLPYGMNTSENLVYRIIHTGKQIEFYVGRNNNSLVLMGAHSNNIPNIYTPLYARFRVTNGISVASSTSYVIHSTQINNYNILNIDGNITGDVFVYQKVKESGSNNSTNNLNASASFIGIGESTFGISGIHINFKSDQQCILQCQQSMDNINWDIVDIWSVPAGIGSGRVFQATASYFRIIVTNNGSIATTYLRLQSDLRPIVECLPRSLSTTGRLKVESVNASGAVTNVLSWVGKNAPYKSMMWLSVASWIIPINYRMSPFQIQYSAGNASSYVRATKRLLLGSFNNSTQVFTDDSSYSLPDFGAYINIYFTSDVGTSRTLTITYVNQDGVAGRTATYALTSGAGGDKNGHMQRITLQSGDVGVRDITNVTTNGTGTATFKLFGETDIFLDSADSSGVVYTDTLPLYAFLVEYGFTISLQITSASTSSVDRMLNLTSIVESTAI